MQTETEFDFINKPADAGESLNEYDYLEQKAIATISRIKEKDQRLNPQQLPIIPQNEEPDDEWKQMMLKQHSIEPGRKRFRPPPPSDNVPRPKRQRREMSMPPPKAGYAPASARHRGRSAEANPKHGGRDRSRSEYQPKSGRAWQANYDDQTSARRWSPWTNHQQDPNGPRQDVHWSSEGTASEAYNKGRGKGRGKWQPVRQGHAHNRHNYASDVGDVGPKAKANPSPVPTPSQSPQPSAPSSRRPSVESVVSIPTVARLPPVPSSAKASTWQSRARPRAASEGSDSVYSYQIPENEIDYDSDREKASKRPKNEDRRVTLEPTPKAKSASSAGNPRIPVSRNGPAVQPKLGCSAAAQPPEPAVPAVSSKPSTQATTMMAQLRELIQMRKDGDIEADEFKVMKAALTRE